MNNRELFRRIDTLFQSKQYDESFQFGKIIEKNFPEEFEYYRITGISAIQTQKLNKATFCWNNIIKSIHKIRTYVFEGQNYSKALVVWINQLYSIKSHYAFVQPSWFYSIWQIYMPNVVMLRMLYNRSRDLIK